MPSTSRSCLRAALVATALLAAACQRQAPAEAPAASPGSSAPDTTTTTAMASDRSAPTASAAAPSLGDFRIVRVSLGRSLDIGNDVAEERSVFTTRDPIYAVVVTTGSHQGLMLSARWFDGNGQLLAQNDQRMVPDGPMLANFHLDPPGGWPKDHYMLDIAVDGLSQQRKEFDVR